MSIPNKTQVAVEEFNKYAKQYQDKYMDVGLYANSLDFFCNNILKENAAILDIACGPGNMAKYILNKKPEVKLLGIDLAPNMVALAKTNNPTSEFRVMDGRDIKMFDKKFDGIMCGFFLPYLSKTEAIDFISNAAKSINKGGILYLSTMEDSYNKSGLKKGSKGDEIFIHYHQADYLIEKLTKNKFNVLKQERIESLMVDERVTDLILIAEKS